MSPLLFTYLNHLKKMKLFYFIIGSTILFSACSSSNDQKQQAETFPITNVIRLDTSIYTDYVADVHAIQNVEIRARVKGYLEKFHVDEGVYVKEGQLLFSINNKEYVEELAKTKAMYKSAMAEVKAAELELKNTLLLADKKIVSGTEIEIAKNKLEAQKAKMEEVLSDQASVQLRLSNTEIRAPFNGIINRIPHKIGSLIDEGTLLTSISENDEVYAYFDVSEKEYLNYARNLLKDSVESKHVTLILADGFEHPTKGKIETIEGIIDERTGNIAFRARFKNPNKILKHGSSGKVRLQKKHLNELVIPQKSTYEIQDKLYVYVVDKNNVVSMRRIETKFRLPHLYIISSGLAENERIVYEGIQSIKDGMTINPQSLKMQSIIKELATK